MDDLKGNYKLVFVSNETKICGRHVTYIIIYLYTDCGWWTSLQMVTWGNHLLLQGLLRCSTNVNGIMGMIRNVSVQADQNGTIRIGDIHKYHGDMKLSNTYSVFLMFFICNEKPWMMVDMVDGPILKDILMDAQQPWYGEFVFFSGSWQII